MSWSDTFDSVLRQTMGANEREIRNDLTPADVEGWDSVAHINLMFAVEEAFGVQFIGSEFAQFENVGDLKRLVANKLGDGRDSA